MKRLRLLTALTMGIMASASGVVQVKAATYNYYVDFGTKEVANYSAFNQTFTEDTYGLDNYIVFSFLGNYRYDSCPTAFTQNVTWRLYATQRPTGASILAASAALPDFVCSTTNTQYFVQLTYQLTPAFLDYIVDDDLNFMKFDSEIRFTKSADTLNRTLTLLGYQFYFELSYDFNTTYLFNYFLSDNRYAGRAQDGATWTFAGTQRDRVTYVFTTAGNDEYFINNTNVTGIGTTRKKYAVDYLGEFFRGESVGVGFNTSITGSDTALFTTSSGTALIVHFYEVYFLNVSNLSQAIVDAPTLNFTEEDCGDFLSLNVGCFINNAFAYIVNDAPIISDAFTLLNAGIEMAAQTFGIIGNFADDNVFGVMILAGFGFIAVKWFLKND